jgi:hypothetical protein
MKEVGHVSERKREKGQKTTKDNKVRFEIFTAVTMKDVVFCDIKTHFVLHRRHISSPLQSPAN